LEIKVYSNDIERALKSLKRELQKEGLFKEIKQRSYYEKLERRNEQREAIKKRKKALRFRKPIQAGKK
jgi:small subunit ribosomal protein S21